MQQQLILQVSGMTCSGCENRIDNALARLDGVRRSSADRGSGQVRVLFDPAQVPAETVRSRIEQVGYTVTGTVEGR
ncbi:hypothetical protein BH20ACT9_BH20ACT9_04200 [soil metagenome]